MKQLRSLICVTALLGAAATPLAHAIDITAGDWKFSVDGNVNGSYIFSNCDASPHVVDGGLACIAPTGSSSVSNGLLPAAIVFSGATNQAGYDLTFTFGFFPGISSNDGGSPNLQAVSGPTNTALATSGLDIRQVFLTFGNDVMGTVLVGRNIGLFASDAILNDMTLVAVGAGNGNYAAPANTALGSIGLGYIYTDWLAQIDYITPKYSGFQASLGVFDPLETLNSNQTSPSVKDTPGFHGKISYTHEAFYLSASALVQKQTGNDEPTVTTTVPFNYTSWAVDFGGKYDAGPLEVLAWYYRADGVGTTALYNFANDPLTGRPRTSDGFLAQITYQFGPTKVGFNYGQSRLQTANFEVNPLLLDNNEKFTLGVYHSLTKALTLTAEFSVIESINQESQSNTSRNVDVGAFLKF